MLLRHVVADVRIGFVERVIDPVFSQELRRRINLRTGSPLPSRIQVAPRRFIGSTEPSTPTPCAICWHWMWMSPRSCQPAEVVHPNGPVGTKHHRGQDRAPMARQQSVVLVDQLLG